MCGRFTQKAPWEKVSREFDIKTEPPENLFESRYNIAPSQMIDVVFEPEKDRILSHLKWD
jgi:putative SOS response-associated peptidase YedK